MLQAHNQYLLRCLDTIIDLASTATSEHLDDAVASDGAGTIFYCIVPQALLTHDLPFSYEGVSATRNTRGQDTLAIFPSHRSIISGFLAYWKETSRG